MLLLVLLQAWLEAHGISGIRPACTYCQHPALPSNGALSSRSTTDADATPANFCHAVSELTAGTASSVLAPTSPLARPPPATSRAARTALRAPRGRRGTLRPLLPWRTS
jgi:hypothetical protein